MEFDKVRSQVRDKIWDEVYSKTIIKIGLDRYRIILMYFAERNDIHRFLRVSIMESHYEYH